MFERFTDRARRALVIAQEESRLLGHNFLGTEHILLGLLHMKEGVAWQVLSDFGVNLEEVRAEVEKTIGPSGTAAAGAPPFTPRAKKVLELGLREALQLGHNYIGTEHILLGLIREGEGIAAQIMRDAVPSSPEDHALSVVRRAVIEQLAPSAMVDEKRPAKTPQVTIAFSAEEALQVVVWLKAVDTVFGGTEGSRAVGHLRKALMRALSISEDEAEEG